MADLGFIREIMFLKIDLIDFDVDFFKVFNFDFKDNIIRNFI